jgi:hypothetical protein
MGRRGYKIESTKELPMKLRTFSLFTVFAAFTIYTAMVVMNHGYTGFIELALAGGWGAQMFIDLVIALLLFMTWMLPDARERGIPSAPYAILILGAGSIGALAYLIHRILKQGSPARRAAHAS